jgi:hypothetical protein
VRPSTWWFVGAFLIAIPLSVFTRAFSTLKITGIKFAGFIISLKIIWTAGWLIRLLVWLVGQGWGELCHFGLET